MMNDSQKLWYLGGPMSGYEEHNFPAFKAAVHRLRTRFGLKMKPAHEVDHGEGVIGAGKLPWEEYLTGDLKVLLQCDGAIFLQGWPESKGARLEFDIAADLGYPIYQYVPTEFGATLVPLSRAEKFK